jgi:hypothetical protein
MSLLQLVKEKQGMGLKLLLEFRKLCIEMAFF